MRPAVRSSGPARAHYIPAQREHSAHSRKDLHGKCRGLPKRNINPVSRYETPFCFSTPYPPPHATVPSINSTLRSSMGRVPIVNRSCIHCWTTRRRSGFSGSSRDTNLTIGFHAWTVSLLPRRRSCIADVQCRHSLGEAVRIVESLRHAQKTGSNVKTSRNESAHICCSILKGPNKRATS